MKDLLFDRQRANTRIRAMSATEYRAMLRAEAFAERVEVDGRLVAPVSDHNVSTYKNRGCRCEVCKAAVAARMVADRARRSKVTADNGGTAPIAKHNASTYTNWSCRCRACRDAWAASQRAKPPPGGHVSTCGTDAGYQAHKRCGTVPCDHCRAAHSAYIRAYRQHNPTPPRQRAFTAARFRALRRLGDRHCAELRKLIAEEQREAGLR